MAKKILIIGGVAGGASFAARMRRLDETARIIMFEKGEFISFANCGLPYYIGDTITSRDNLIIQSPQQFTDRFAIDVRIRSEVTGVDTAKKTVTVQQGDQTYTESWDYLLLAPGAKPFVPPMEGGDNPRIFTVRTIPDTDRIKAAIHTAGVSRALVIGGGFIGLEMAENLRHKNMQVTLVELADQVFMPADKEMAAMLHQHLHLCGVDLRLSDSVTKIAESSDHSLAVTLKSGQTLLCDVIIAAIGVIPDTEFLKSSGITLGQRGAIVVDETMRTNIPQVFAVGDAVEVTDFVSGNKVLLPLAGPANRQARIAADQVAGLASTYKNTQGTAICKIFDLTAAVTGINEKNARRLNLDYAKSYTHSASHAGYYPGSFPLSIKILFSPKDGTVLGAQVIGTDGIDKRIDVLATVVRHGLTVYDLSELELAYAPPYGSAKDPVNIAGFVAQNILNKTMPVCYPEDIATVDTSREILLDVRSADEHAMGSIPGSTLIPLNNLRARISELDTNKRITIYCQVGLRGYVAARILMQRGFSVRNLSGGYKTYEYFAGTRAPTATIKPVTEVVCSTPTSETAPSKNTIVDACGMQCPGPILKLRKALDALVPGDTVEISATDQGFAADIPVWCNSTGNTLENLAIEHGIYKALVKKGGAIPPCTGSACSNAKKTMVVFSNDLDRAMAAFIIANGAASMGSEVTLFFTFWGLNLLRKNGAVAVKKNLLENLFGFMMPRGAGKSVLSKMHMGGMGTAMMRLVMKQKNVFSLPDLMTQAQKSNIRFVACAMTMDIMGIKKEELIDGVEFGGVAAYLGKADESGYNLFV